MVQDDDVLEKEELGILEQITGFVSQHDVIGIPAAKQLLVSIKRAVCLASLTLLDPSHN